MSEEIKTDSDGNSGRISILGDIFFSPQLPLAPYWTLAESNTQLKYLL